MKLIYYWTIPINIPKQVLPYLTYALWFIPVYLLVMSFFPFFRMIYNKLIETKFQIIPLIIFAFLLFIINMFHIGGNYMRMLLFYGFWTYLGLFYSKLFDKNVVFLKKKVALGMSAVCVIILIALRIISPSSFTLDMQTNKFPPNFIFLLYTFSALNIMYILSDYIVKIIKWLKQNSIFDWIFKQYTEYGMTIYLFQSFTFLFLRYVLNPVFDAMSINGSILQFFIYLLLSILLSAILGKIFSWCEKINIFKF